MPADPTTEAGRDALSFLDQPYSPSPAWRESILAIEHEAANRARAEVLAEVEDDLQTLTGVILGGSSYKPHREAAERVRAFLAVAPTARDKP